MIYFYLKYICIPFQCLECKLVVNNLSKLYNINLNNFKEIFSYVNKCTVMRDKTLIFGLSFFNKNKPYCYNVCSLEFMGPKLCD